MQTERIYCDNHDVPAFPPVVSILLEAAERWQWAHCNASMMSNEAFTAAHNLDSAVIAWINSPYRRPSPVDRAAIRGIVDGLVSHLLQCDAKYRLGQISSQETYHQIRNDATDRAVADILRVVGMANLQWFSVPNQTAGADA